MSRYRVLLQELGPNDGVKKHTNNVDQLLATVLEGALAQLETLHPEIRDYHISMAVHDKKDLNATLERDTVSGKYVVTLDSVLLYPLFRLLGLLLYWGEHLSDPELIQECFGQVSYMLDSSLGSYKPPYTRKHPDEFTKEILNSSEALNHDICDNYLAMLCFLVNRALAPLLLDYTAESKYSEAQELEMDKLAYTAQLNAIQAQAGQQAGDKDSFLYPYTWLAGPMLCDIYTMCAFFATEVLCQPTWPYALLCETRIESMLALAEAYTFSYEEGARARNALMDAIERFVQGWRLLNANAGKDKHTEK